MVVPWHELRRHLEPGLLQFAMALALTIFGLVWEPVGLPNVTELVALASTLFAHYGLPVVFLASFIEAIFMVNFYFPGSFVILLAILVSDHSYGALSAIVVVVWTACIMASMVNYALGHYGFYRGLLWLGNERIITHMQAWLDKRGGTAVVLSSIHPNFLAVAVVCMGIAREGFLHALTLAALGLCLWLPIEIATIEFLSPKPTETGTFFWYLVLLFAAWGVAAIGIEKYKHRQQRIEHGV